MSTRCQIAAKLSDGRGACIYVHCDGYPDRMLPLLRTIYGDQAAVDALIALGDCLAIGPSLARCQPFGAGDDAEPWEDVCPTYAETPLAAAKAHQHGDEDYRYLWDGEQWAQVSL